MDTSTPEAVTTMAGSLPVISIVAFILGAVLLVITLVVFIQLDIPKAFGSLTGSSAKKGIRHLQLRGFQGTANGEPIVVEKTGLLRRLRRKEAAISPPAIASPVSAAQQAPPDAGDGAVSRLRTAQQASSQTHDVTVPLSQEEQLTPPVVHDATMPLSQAAQPPDVAQNATVPLAQEVKADTSQEAQSATMPLSRPPQETVPLAQAAQQDTAWKPRETVPLAAGETVPLQERTASETEALSPKSVPRGETVPLAVAATEVLNEEIRASNQAKDSSKTQQTQLLQGEPVDITEAFLVTKRAMKTESKTVIPIQQDEN